MQKHSTETEKLTRNQALVFGSLQKADGPLSAYEILDRLREDGLRAPLQIYRALDALVKIGRVHKLESLNAFIACSHPNCETHTVSAFGICDECSEVFEIADSGFNDALKRLAQTHSFSASKAMVELHGRCKDCQRITSD